MRKNRFTLLLPPLYKLSASCSDAQALRRGKTHGSELLDELELELPAGPAAPDEPEQPNSLQDVLDVDAEPLPGPVSAAAAPELLSPQRRPEQLLVLCCISFNQVIPSAVRRLT